MFRPRCGSGTKKLLPTSGLALQKARVLSKMRAPLCSSGFVRPDRRGERFPLEAHGAKHAVQIGQGCRGLRWAMVDHGSQPASSRWSLRRGEGASLYGKKRAGIFFGRCRLTSADVIRFQGNIESPPHVVCHSQGTFNTGQGGDTMRLEQLCGLDGYILWQQQT